ncbi:MAG: methyltransferase domain-containing protein [Candidatus Andersenbacteria bacterium]
MTEEQSFIRPEEFWRTVGLRAEQTVVHFGAGAGFYLVPAAHIVGKNGKAIGIDVLPDMLAEAESRSKRENVDSIIQVIRANLENPKGSSLPDNTADWVLLANIIYQSDIATLLREAMRVVAANGHIVIVGWDVVASPFGPPVSQRIPAEEITRVASEVGLYIAKKFAPSPYHYALVLSKQKS